MKLRKLHLAALLTLPFVLGASACDKLGRPQAILPPAADLREEPKPVPGIEILTDAEAEARHNSAIEAWGERGWATVGRICRWAKAHGSTIPCQD